MGYEVGDLHPPGEPCVPRASTWKKERELSLKQVPLGKPSLAGPGEQSWAELTATDGTLFSPEPRVRYLCDPSLGP